MSKRKGGAFQFCKITIAFQAGAISKITRSTAHWKNISSSFHRESANLPSAQTISSQNGQSFEENWEKDIDRKFPRNKLACKQEKLLGLTCKRRRTK